MVDASGFEGAFRKAPAQDHDRVRMNERILDDQPIPDGQKHGCHRAREHDGNRNGNQPAALSRF
jgi:hypothetical protein